MKNQRIIRAYDSINPTPDQKDRMLRAILSESGEKPKGRSVYTATPRKTSARGLLGAIAACLVVLVMSGVVLARMMGRETPAQTQPVEMELVEQLHEELLKLYRSAMVEGWTAEKCLEKGISPRFSDTEYAKENAAFALLDIDGNGVEELIIGYGMTHYFYVWDLYTFDNGDPVQLHSDQKDGTNCHIYENGVIGTEYTGKTEGAYSYFKLDGATFISLDVLTYRDDFWYDEISKQQISAEEATSRLNQYEMLDIHATSLFDYSGNVQVNTESAEYYMFVIEKYKTALLENWTWEQCDQADISRQIMFNTTNMNDLGWCLLDLDGNGVEELIISDGNQLFDLYTLMPTDNSPGHILSANTVHYTLCKDGTIEQREHVQQVNTYWRWFRLDGMDQILQEVVYLEGEKHQYFHGTTEDSLKKISENQAGAYLVNTEKEPMNLALTPFVEKEFSVVKEPNFYYEALIETYRKAIEEDWDPGKCMENGISLMVGYYGDLVTALGHNQIDLNGDGNDELIITDGTNIYDLYTIINDEEIGPLRLIDATERNQFFLTTEGQIYNMASGSAMLSYYYLLDIGQKELVFDKGVKFDASVDLNNPWSYYEENMDKAADCTEEDARVILDAIHFADIPYIPFK